MATARKREFFQTFPQTENQPGFAKHNHPTAEMFADLFASQAFILNYEDKATKTRQGLAMAADDSSTYSFSSLTTSTTGTDFVRPHQLPEISLDGVVLEDDVEKIEYGMSITRLKPSRTGGTGMKYILKLGIDPTYFEFRETGELTLKGKESLITEGRYFYSIMNGVVSWESSTGFTSYWEITDNQLTPKDNKAVNFGIVNTYGGAFLMDPAGDKVIGVMPAQAGNDGGRLIVMAGHGTGVNKLGGSLYLMGGNGTNGSADGNVYLCYSGGPIGVAAIAGGPSTDLDGDPYMLTVHGRTAITGYVKISEWGAGAELGPIFLDEFGILKYVPNVAAMQALFPAGTEGSTIMYNQITQKWSSVWISDEAKVDADGYLTFITQERVIVSDAATGRLTVADTSIDDVELMAGLSAVLDPGDISILANAEGNVEFSSSGVYFPKGIRENIVTVGSALSNYTILSSTRIVIVEIHNGGTDLYLPDIAIKTYQVVEVIVKLNATGSDLVIHANGAQAISYKGAENATATLTAVAAGTVVRLHASEDGLWVMSSFLSI